MTIHVVQQVHYVFAGAANPSPPYTDWATAATNIQEAIAAATEAGALVVVSNGVYAGGVTMTTPLALSSVNGPQFTVINGGRTNQCISYLPDGASLTGFTLTNGVNNEGGGGVSGGSTNASVTNCLIMGNLAFSGGGAYGCTLYNCTLSGDSAPHGEGGGAFSCTLYNCISYFNTALSGEPNYAASTTLNYCCTTPLPPSGIGNITNAPLFVDSTNGNLRLQSNSPCINAGNLAYVMTATDLDGNPRIVNGAVDIGAYEYQTPGSGISYAWLQRYGLPTDGSVDHADLDGTGLTVYQDWVAGLNPTNALSVLAALPPARASHPAGLVISWESVANISYFVERSTNLTAQPAFTTLQTNIIGQAGTTTFTDTNAAGPGPFFYRVGVLAP